MKGKKEREEGNTFPASNDTFTFAGPWRAEGSGRSSFYPLLSIKLSKKSGLLHKTGMGGVGQDRTKEFECWACPRDSGFRTGRQSHRGE